MFGGVYLKFSSATEFIFITSTSDLEFFTIVARRVERELLFKRISNVSFSDKGSNLPPYDHKSNTKPLKPGFHQIVTEL